MKILKKLSVHNFCSYFSLKKIYFTNSFWFKLINTLIENGIHLKSSLIIGIADTKYEFLLPSDDS